jgi:two-component system, OmpR family, KDP operon response regulator KdpE
MTKSARALVFHEYANRNARLRTAICGQGCEVDEALFDPEAAAKPVEGYCFVLFNVQRPTQRLLQIIRDWRQDAPNTALVVAGNGTTQATHVALLEAGADAFLPLSESVSLDELAARAHAAVRRCRVQDPPLNQLSFGSSVIDLKARSIRSCQGQFHLTKTESGLLEHFAAHPNRTVPCMELVRSVWGSDPHKGPHSLRFLIKSLRRKLEPDPAHPRYLITEPTNGYRLQISAHAHPRSRRHDSTPREHTPREVPGNLGEMTLGRLRMAIRNNEISFPSQIPIFCRQPQLQIQWRLAALFFVHSWPCTDLGKRYGLSARYAQQLISQWAQRAIVLGYLQEIPAAETLPFPPDAITPRNPRARTARVSLADAVPLTASPR